MATKDRKKRHVATLEEKELIISLKLQGLNSKEIGEQVLSSVRSICRILNEAGLIAKDGPSHHKWKAERRVSDQGYVLLYLPKDHPLRRKHSSSILEHRFVMSEYLGRPLESYETVHHINGDRQDNRLENLQLRIGLHGRGQVARCRACGSFDIDFDPLAGG
jgi:hypothetical protein